MTSHNTNQNFSSHSATDKAFLNSSKNLQMFKPVDLSSVNPILFGTDNIFNANFVERELECQICLSPLDSPVLLACNSHSLCLSCMTSLFKHQKKQKDGSRAIFCPSCGLLSGMMKVKKPEHFKVNKELERVQKAYEKERSLWIEEKVKLETQLNCLENSLVEEQPLKKEKGKASKKGLSAQDEKSLKSMLDSFGPEKLKAANQLMLDYIKGEEKDLVTPVKRVTRRGKNKEEEHEDSANTTPSLNGGSNIKKSTSQRGGLWFYLGKNVKHNTTDDIKRENTVSVETLEKKEYALRSLKRTRTNQL